MFGSNSINMPIKKQKVTVVAVLAKYDLGQLCNVALTKLAIIDSKFLLLPSLSSPIVSLPFAR